MSNLQIEKALIKERDTLYETLSRKTLSGLFKDEYESIQSGVTVLLNEKDKYLSELLELIKDTSYDQDFVKRVEQIKNLNDSEIINGFEQDLQKLIEFIQKNSFENDIQAIFIEYDYYTDHKAVASAYGKQNYPTIYTPRYISSEIDFSNTIFIHSDNINFDEAWVDCDDFEWVENYIEAYSQLQQMFQCHSRVLLHRALHNLEVKRQLNFLTARPFMFYINEHDSEVMTLYSIE